MCIYKLLGKIIIIFLNKKYLMLTKAELIWSEIE